MGAKEPNWPPGIPSDTADSATMWAVDKFGEYADAGKDAIMKVLTVFCVAVALAILSPAILVGVLVKHPRLTAALVLVGCAWFAWSNAIR